MKLIYLCITAFYIINNFNVVQSYNLTDTDDDFKNVNLKINEKEFEKAMDIITTMIKERKINKVIAVFDGKRDVSITDEIDDISDIIKLSGITSIIDATQFTRGRIHAVLTNYLNTS